MTFKNKIIAITRPAERSQEAVDIIENWGGTALVAPTLELQISSSQSLTELCKMAKKLDWLIFTSPTAILSLFKHCKDLKEHLNPECKIAVIGPRTGNYLTEYGHYVALRVSFILWYMLLFSGSAINSSILPSSIFIFTFVFP